MGFPYSPTTPTASDNELSAVLKTCLAVVSGGTGGTGTKFTTGTGSPEGVVTGSPGDRFFATDTNFLYTKITGVGNTGWSIT